MWLKRCSLVRFYTSLHFLLAHASLLQKLQKRSRNRARSKRKAPKMIPKIVSLAPQANSLPVLPLSWAPQATRLLLLPSIVASTSLRISRKLSNHHSQIAPRPSKIFLELLRTEFFRPVSSQLSRLPRRGRRHKA